MFEIASDARTRDAIRNAHAVRGADLRAVWVFFRRASHFR